MNAGCVLCCFNSSSAGGGWCLSKWSDQITGCIDYIFIQACMLPGIRVREAPLPCLCVGRGERGVPGGICSESRPGSSAEPDRYRTHSPDPHQSGGHHNPAGGRERVPPPKPSHRPTQQHNIHTVHNNTNKHCKQMYSIFTIWIRLLTRKCVFNDYSSLQKAPDNDNDNDNVSIGVGHSVGVGFGVWPRLNKL